MIFKVHYFILFNLKIRKFKLLQDKFKNFFFLLQYSSIYTGEFINIIRLFSRPESLWIRSSPTSFCSSIRLNIRMLEQLMRTFESQLPSFLPTSVSILFTFLFFLVFKTLSLVVFFSLLLLFRLHLPLDLLSCDKLVTTDENSVYNTGYFYKVNFSYLYP